MAVGNSPNVTGTSGYQRMLLQHGIDQNGQAPSGAGVTEPKAEPSATAEPSNPFIGKGELLEAEPQEAFRVIDALVVRQDPLARNRFAIDKHYTATKKGYWGSTLTKVENVDQWQQSFLPGTQNALQSGPVPNKQAELCQRLTETLLVDPPKPDPLPLDDDEAAQRGAELARRFLEQDGGEHGTDDQTLFAYQVEAGTTRGAVYNYYWMDPTGGGAVPKQIKAHPEAIDPANPLIGPDGQPTTDYILRYVTAGDPESGAPAQFTDHPAEAAVQWQPRLRIEKLGREHVRLYPETADLHAAQQSIVIHYCTVSEAKRRWPETLGQLDDAAFAPIVAWLPLRPLALLPSALRPTFKQGMEASREGALKRGAMDQRLLFYYCYAGLPEPDYPEGAVLFLNGANGGMVFGRDTLSAEVQIPSERTQDEMVTDRKLMDLPLAELRLLPDVDDRDPTGLPFMARIAGAGEAGAMLATGMMELLDRRLHPVRYNIATSPVDPDTVESARALGGFVPINGKDDIPILEQLDDLPGEWLPYQQWLYQGMDESAGLRPPDQAQESKVKSGIALRIEIQEASKVLTRMNRSLHNCWARHARLKLQFAMKFFSADQLIRYTGNDGAAKQEWFTGNDFARVGGIQIATGSGTMLPPTEKVNLAVQLASMGIFDADRLADIALPQVSKQLGGPENPHIQRIERQVSSWLEGPPADFEQQQMAYQQAVVQHAEQTKMEIQAGAMGPSVPPPEAPWSPFAAEVMDVKPAIAAVRARRLETLMAKTEFSKFPKPWQDVARVAWQQANGAMQAAQMAAQAAQQPNAKPGQPKPKTEPTQDAA